MSSSPARGEGERRTQLAAERTWLAWWRSGIAAATAAVAVGGVVPELVDESRALYAVLGIGYALLAAAVFVGSGLRQRRLAAAIDRDDYEPASMAWVTGLTVAGAVLAVATLAMIVANA